MTHPLDALLTPRTIAFIGASQEPDRIGGMPLAHMRHFGYQGKVYPINPKYAEIQGFPAYPDIEHLPETPDLAILAIAARDVLPMLRRCHAKGVRAAILYASGFSEADQEGTQLQQELEDFVRATDMAVAGPNCMGFANLNLHAYTAFASVFRNAPPQQGPGRVSIVTQSGNVCSAVFGLIRAQGVPVSHFVNTGNEACLEFSQYLDYLAMDAHTDCTVGYVEQLRDGRRFIAAALAFAASDKPLILYKVGESEKGIQAALSHTAALAGDLRIYRAVFDQLNVIQSDDFVQMADLAYLSGFKSRAGGKRACVLTMSGAIGAILADKLTAAGLDIPDLPQDVQAILDGLLPSYGMTSNPVDLTGNIVNQPQVLETTLDALSATDAIDVVIVYAPGYLLDRMAGILESAARKSPKLFVAIDTGNATCRAQLAEAGVPVLTDLGRATRALGPFCRWLSQRQAVAEWARLHAQADAPAASVAPDIGPGAPEHQIRQWLSRFGLTVPEEKHARTADEAAAFAAQIGAPVALKVLSADIPHKTEANGIRLGLTEEGAVRHAFTDIIDAAARYDDTARLDGVLVQRMARDSVAELIVGVIRDPVFGLTLTVGLGGVLTELYRDTSHRLLPVSRDMAFDMLRELRVWPLLDGFRGRPPADVDAACAAIAAISEAAMALDGQIEELEINPLLLQPRGGQAVAVDTLVRWTTAAAPTDRVPS